MIADWSQSYQKVLLITRDYLEDLGMGSLSTPCFLQTLEPHPQCPTASCAKTFLVSQHLHGLL